MKRKNEKWPLYPSCRKCPSIKDSSVISRKSRSNWPNWQTFDVLLSCKPMSVLMNFWSDKANPSKFVNLAKLNWRTIHQKSASIHPYHYAFCSQDINWKFATCNMKPVLTLMYRFSIWNQPSQIRLDYIFPMLKSKFSQFVTCEKEGPAPVQQCMCISESPFQLECFNIA